MNHLFTLSVALCLAVTGFAQGFSAGIITGGTFWIPNKNDTNEGWYKQGKKLTTWDKGAFLRYETCGRIAIEASYNNFKINSRHWDDYRFPKTGNNTYDTSQKFKGLASSVFN